MEKEINIAELLRDCPNGMPLDCAMYDNLHFDKVDDYDKKIHCYIQYKDHRTHIMFGKDGTYNSEKASKCVIFPKGKTTWEGFVPPVKFKDGDVLVSDNESCIYIYIYNGVEDCFNHSTYVSVNLNGSFLVNNKIRKTDSRFATEEEKEILFKAIEEKGYKWYQDTKSLVKLFKPNFKVGDRIRNKTDKYLAERTIKSYVEGIGYFTTINDWVRITDQDNWELVPVVKPLYKVGDRIKQKNGNTKVTILSVEDWKYIIEDSEGICSIMSISTQDNWELVPNKFDITTLKPFESRVLVRDSIKEKWHPAIWGFYDDNSYNSYPYKLIGDMSLCCIPYEGNEHLLGKTDDCDDYFKTWES